MEPVQQATVASDDESRPGLSKMNSNNDKPSGGRKTEDDDNVVYPSGPKLWLLMISLCLSVFLVALDQTIIAPALGAITGEFNSTKEYVGWSLFYLSPAPSTYPSFVRVSTLLVPIHGGIPKNGGKIQRTVGLNLLI
jgi:hypothetical protein